MATLVFAKQFLDDFARLDPVVRQKVRELPDKFEDATHSGLHLEKLASARDERVRTVRVDKFWRGVVVRLGEGRFALLRVLAHDDAIDWATRQRFGVNPVTGLVEILDIPRVETRIDEVTSVVPDEAPRLFSALRDRDFEQVGIDPELVPLLRRIVDEAELLAVANLLPDAQSDALLLLADGKSPEEVWREISKDYEIPDEEVDVDDLEVALERPGTRSAFIVTTTDQELVELLSGDFEAWRTFLHPTQRSVAYKPIFRGPAKVTGGAGTGKTVVAIHRAKFLAQQLIDDREPTRRVLFATYTRSLADNLDHTLRTFCTPEEYRRIQVSTVDAFARQTISAAGSKIRPVPDDALRDLASEAAIMGGLDELGLDGRFLVAEWEQVVLARGITNLAAYVTTPRPGRGGRLARANRKTVWSAVERLVSELSRRNLATYPQIANTAADLLGSRQAAPFAHVVVDEAQDLHPTQWRLLRSAVREGPNDLFIVGDAQQRIYDNKVSLRSLGIDSRGNSRRLKINYRTSQQILGWCLGILTGSAPDDLDGDLEPVLGYRSAFNGPPPQVERFTTPAEEAGRVASVIKGWITDGVLPSSIGVIARTKNNLIPTQGALESLGIAWHEVGTDRGKGGVRTSTMHSCKGLEFARLTVVAVNASNLPLPQAVTPREVDEIQNAIDVERERALLYVACTRARDALMVTSSGISSPLLPLSQAR
jgi:hypothetical protein